MCKEKAISNEDDLKTVGTTQTQVVSKHLLNEPNFVLDPKYSMYTYEGRHTHAHTHTEADTQRTSCEKYPNAFSYFIFFGFFKATRNYALR